ncbi:21 kDa protein [Linum perenne]
MEWHVSNVVTWVSAALTNENTCVDGFEGKALNGRMKDGIRGRFRNTVMVTSNALALINKYANH